MIGSLERMIDDMNAGVFDFTDNGKCTNCGQCCTALLPVTKAEVEVMHRYVRKHNVKPHQTSPLISAPVIDFTCPFRNEMLKKCDIYPARPKICRDFKCDKPKKGEQKDDAPYDSAVQVINMRDEFCVGDV